MARSRNSFKMGMVEMLVLFLLDKKELYGYEISLLIRKLSNGKIEIQESTLYPTFYKLLDKGYISDKEVIIGKRRIRVYYHLEELGRKRLSDLLEDYHEISLGVNSILSISSVDNEVD